MRNNNNNNGTGNINSSSIINTNINNNNNIYPNTQTIALIMLYNTMNIKRERIIKPFSSLRMYLISLSCGGGRCSGDPSASLSGPQGIPKAQEPGAIGPSDLGTWDPGDTHKPHSHPPQQQHKASRTHGKDTWKHVKHTRIHTSDHTHLQMGCQVP